MWVEKKAKRCHQCWVVLGPGTRGPQMFEGYLFGPYVLLLPLALTSHTYYSCPTFVLQESKAKTLNGVSHSFIPSRGTPMPQFTDCFIHLNIYVNLFLQSGCLLCPSLSQSAMILKHLSLWLCVKGTVSNVGMNAWLSAFHFLPLLQALMVTIIGERVFPIIEHFLFSFAWFQRPLKQRLPSYRPPVFVNGN